MKMIEAKRNFSDAQKAKEFVRLCENEFEKRMDDVVDEICKDTKIKLIALSGPTCSGKTTAANKLISEFKKYGKNIHVVSIDDFYYDKDYLNEISKKDDPNAAIDYDSIKTIDFDALVKCVDEIFTKGKTMVPRFDFKVGKKVGYVEYNADEGDMFLFEGIQAIYPEITAVFKKYPSKSVMICPMSAIKMDDLTFEPNEIRLMRRLVRDYNFRDTAPEFTMYMWKSVRDNEDLSIFPNMQNCDLYIDSTLAFEINILKPYLDKILKEFPEDNEFIERADRILKKIDNIESIPRDYISKNSIYNEFI